MVFDRMERKDRIQLAMNSTSAKTANSSKNVVPDKCSTRKEVMRMKQMPKRLEDALSICEDFSLPSFIKKIKN